MESFYASHITLSQKGFVSDSGQTLKSQAVIKFLQECTQEQMIQKWNS